ncbi:hypothetical protein HRG84_07735 [Flavisolibacter sp. BT320]|nr:hypothetical protein [Flavisolibacter longurius]
MELQEDTNRPYVTYVLAAWACAGYAIKNKKATNHRVRLLHVYAFLQHYAGPIGVIEPGRCNAKGLAAACGLSLNTFKRWATVLHKEEWIIWKESSIQLRSEKEIYALLGLHYGRGSGHRFYFAGDITKLKQPFYWIFLADIEANKRRQAFRFVQKVKADQEALEWLQEHLNRKGHGKGIIDRDPLFIAALFHSEYLTQFQNQKLPKLAFLRENRADVNRSTHGMARQYGTGATTISRIKAKLLEQGLALVQKTKTVSSHVRNHNQSAHVRYNEAKKVTFQAFCDDIVPIKNYNTKSGQQVFKPP